MKGRLKYLLVTVVCLLALGGSARAQFQSEAFTQNYSNDQTDADTTALWSFKDYFRGLAHKDTLKAGSLFAGSTVFIGGQQIYEKKYWKLPIIYGGLGATVGLGFHYRSVYNKSLDAYNSALELDPNAEYTVDTKAKSMMNTMFIAGGLIYWGTLMDGVINYAPGDKRHPGKATLYSILVPGLGQIYNGEYWKVPIYWGCLLGAYHFFDNNQMQYNRFRRIYKEATDPDSGYSERITSETAKYYRDLYREYRDYSILAIAAFYLLQIIDANVFCYMQDFEVSDDISMKISPTIITQDNQYALQSPLNAGVGMKLGFRF